MKARSMKWLLPVALVGLLAVAGGSWAHGGGFMKGGHPGMNAGFERFYHMADMLDMTDAQEAQLGEIISRAKGQMAPEDDVRSLMKEFMTGAKPDEAGYDVELNSLADKAAANARKKVLIMGQVRKEVHALLTDEQKEKLQTFMERKLKRMESKGRWHKQQ